MPKATITSKNQITLPKEVRVKLGVAPGDQVEFRIDADGDIVVVPAKGTASRLFGMLWAARDEPISIEEMDRSIDNGLAADDDRIRAHQP